MRHAVRAAMLFVMVLYGVAHAATFTDSFDEGGLDPESYLFNTRFGFTPEVVDKKLVLTKTAGADSGFVSVTTVLTIKGDFEVTILAGATAATPGWSAGLSVSDYDGGVSDIFFSGTANLKSRILVSPVASQQTIAVPSSSLAMRIRRVGDRLIHEYDAGEGYVQLNDAIDPKLAGPVVVSLFLSEETAGAGAAAVSFDDLLVAADALTPPCGNGVLEVGEDCDDDSPEYGFGDYCDSTCELVSCGDTNDSGTVTVVDALHTLRTSVESTSCDDCVCDVDSSGGGTNVSDALRILRVSVGQAVTLGCPACG
jgi:hypothetical protein